MFSWWPHDVGVGVIWLDDDVMVIQHTISSHTPGPAIVADGLSNWRDIGGVPTALSPEPIVRGMVYRSDSFAALSPAAIDVVRAHGIGKVIDLRSDQEVERHGRFHDREVEWVHRPMGGPSWFTDNGLDGDDPMAAMYRSMTSEMATTVVDVLDIIASTTVPVVLHCTSGKDRTGVVAALLQTALGVADEIVAAEYLASAENLVGHMEVMKSRYPDMAAMIPAALQARFGGVERGWLDSALEPVQTVGGLERWLAVSGGTSDTIDRLRSRLVVR